MLLCKDNVFYSLLPAPTYAEQFEDDFEDEEEEPRNVNRVYIYIQTVLTWFMK